MESIKQSKLVTFDCIVLCLYFILYPFEHIINFGDGTIIKYLAGLYVIMSFFLSSGKRHTINFYDPIFFIPLLFIVISQLSVLWSVNIDESIRMNSPYLYMNLFFLAAYIRKYNEKEQKLIKKSILLGGFLISLYILFFNSQLLTNSTERLILKEEADPNFFAAIIALPLMVSFSELIASKNKIIIFLFISLLLLIFLTGSRGAMVGTFVSLMFYIAKNIKYKTITIYLFIGIILLLVIIPILPEFIIERLWGKGRIIGDFETDQGRSYIWFIVFTKILPVMPIMGFGTVGSYTMLIPYFGELKAVHNTYFNMLLEYGVLGLPLYLYLLRKIYLKINFEQNYSKLLPFITILIICFFLDAYHSKFLWSMLVFCIIGVSHNKQSKMNMFISKKNI